MSIVENIKDVAKLVQQLDNVELLSKIISLQTEVYSLVQENLNLKDEISLLEKNAVLSEELIYKDNAYWKNNDGPFCSNCWDNEKKLIRIHSTDKIRGHCPNCKTNVIFDIIKFENEKHEFQNDISYLGH